METQCTIIKNTYCSIE